MRHVPVHPFDGLGRLVVVTDIANQLSSQIAYGSENASGNQVPFDLGKPQFDLVQPGRISGREMQVQLWMIGQKALHATSLMIRKIVYNDVHLALRRLTA